MFTVWLPPQICIQEENGLPAVPLVHVSARPRASHLVEQYDEETDINATLPSLSDREKHCLL